MAYRLAKVYEGACQAKGRGIREEGKEAEGRAKEGSLGRRDDLRKVWAYAACLEVE